MSAIEDRSQVCQANRLERVLVEAGGVRSCDGGRAAVSGERDEIHLVATWHRADATRHFVATDVWQADADEDDAGRDVDQAPQPFGAIARDADAMPELLEREG